MTEIEMRLLLLRYNMLSKKEAVFTCGRADEVIGYRDKWLECRDEMAKIRDDLRKYGYDFTYARSKIVGKVKYIMYKIVPMNDEEESVYPL